MTPEWYFKVEKNRYIVYSDLKFSKVVTKIKMGPEIREEFV